MLCTDNNPPPVETSLQWLDPDGNILTTDPFLNISGVTLGQAGEYQCKVTSSRSEDDTGSATVNIIVVQQGECLRTISVGEVDPQHLSKYLIIASNYFVRGSYNSFSVLCNRR